MRPLRFRVVAAAAMMIAALLATVAVASSAAAVPTTDDWVTALHDPQRTAASADTNIGASAVPTLTKLWTVATGGPVASTPTVVNGVAYFGSWDGNEYAVNATTGAIVWKTFLGVTTATQPCNPQAAGISSPATVQSGVVYVGGGDAYWYALDAQTGAVRWRVLVGNPGGSGYDGHYNWSGPLLSNGYAYVGVASFGDCPLVQGQLLKVNLTTHAIENTANMVPNGQIGGGIWTMPAADPVTNTIYVATGTETTPVQQYAQALVAIDAGSMAIKDHWKLPETSAVFDSDFGTSTTLFTDANGHRDLALINKNGYAYAFNRASLSSGPIWQQTIAIGGDCPTCGQSSVSSGAFGGGMLFMAGGAGVVNEVGYKGTVRALNPATGAYAWQHPAPGNVIGALAYDNGMVFDGAGSVLEVLDAQTGARLFSYDTGSQIYAGPSIAEGVVYTGNVQGVVTAFALPPTSPPPPPDPNCPAGFTCQDVGSPSPTGAEAISAGNWTVTAGGSGMAGQSDSFRLMSEPTSGDAQVAAEVTQPPTGPSPQAGIMVRQSADAGSPYYAALAGPNATLAVQYRSAFGGATTVVPAGSPASTPVYLMIQRRGDAFQAATSTDGVNYTLVPGSNASLPLPAVSLAGPAVSSGGNGTPGTASMAAVTIGVPGPAPSPASSASACPAGWSCQDIGNPLTVGDQSLSPTGTWSLKGAGAGIEDQHSSEQVHSVWKSVPGDGTVSARIAGQTSTSTSARAGVMLRGDSSPSAPYYAALVTPNNGIVVQYRDTAGLISAQSANPNGSAPTYLEVARSGDAFTTYTSADGQSWTPVTLSTVALPNMATMLAGLAVTSGNTQALSTATFDTVSIANTAPLPPNGCPTGWSCTDIGVPSLPGSQTQNNGSWAVQASGGDIWSTADQFRLVSQGFAGDGSVIARVNSQDNTSQFAKAGVMIRLSASSTAPYYGVFVTPGNGVAAQYRTVQDGNTTGVGTSGTVPTYLKVSQTGTAFTAYTSSDGGTWTLVPGSGVSIPALTGSLRAGMAVTSHNSQAIGTSVFDNVNITSSGITGLPPQWSDGDIGGATPGGNASFANGIYTVQGGGNDIWQSNDQFNYVSQPLSSDGSIVAGISSQGNTDPWAKSGVIIKQSTAPGSAYAMVSITPGNGVVFQYGYANNVSGGTYSFPGAWVRLDKVGSVFIAYTSNDGSNWSKVGQAVINMAGQVTTGLAVTSHNPNVLNTTTFHDVIVTPTGGGPLPSPWASGDVGAPVSPGSASYTNGAFTLNGAGNDIWAGSDQFQYVSQPLTGNGIITARVTSQDNTDPWAKAGVMIKQSTAAGSPYALVAVTPGNGVHMEYNYNTDVAGGTFAFPNAWLRLQRLGNTITTFQSADGANWTIIGSASLTMTDPITVGLFVTSHNEATLSNTIFDNVQVVAGGGALPSPWASGDVGAPVSAGSASYANGAFTLNGAGNDIWAGNDQFQYVSQPLSGNGTITARVTSQGNTDPWAKAGVMIKQSTAAGSPYALVAVTPGHGVHMEYNYNADVAGGTFAFPNAWLRLQRLGSTITTFQSIDGANWTTIGTASLTMTDPVTLGLFVTSHNASTLNATTFDNVGVVAGGNTVPSPWAAGDVGSPGQAGSTGFANGVFTLNGAGNDIWAGSDQFQYVSQPLTGNGTVTARVTSQGNTDPWAKAGVMIKQSTTAGTPYALVAVTPGNGVHMQFNYNTDIAGGTFAFPNAWLRLQRLGNTITTFQSSDGVTWTTIGTTSLTMTDPVTVGLFVTSHNASTLNTTTFDNVVMTAG